MSFWFWLSITATIFLLGEAAFRVVLRLRGVHFEPPKTSGDLYIVPHPYLPYVYRPGSLVGNAQSAPYPLHKGRYEFRSHRINNIRFFNEDVGPKQPGVCRVMCLGASTTANSLWELGDLKEYSYPLCLKDALDARVGSGRCEVLNCGMGGWTSAEILINFALHLIDLQPDVVVLYHGFNDLEASLTAPFASDYSHSRKNFGEAYARIKFASYWPNFRSWKSYVFIKGRLLGFGNVRYDLLSSIRAGKADLDNPFMGLDTERRNIEHLIHLCKANGVQIILSTFAYHLYARVSQERRALKYRDGVAMENTMLRELAARHDLPLVDVASQIPDHDDYFADTIHFTPEGMRWVADRFAERIVNIMNACAECLEQSGRGASG